MRRRFVMPLALAAAQVLASVAAPSPALAQGRGPGEITVAPRDRDTVRGYYRVQVAAGTCPPGLVKRRNACHPPGDGKKVWTLGRPLPNGVAWSPLPAALLARLTPPPYGYEYVRLGSDVLVIARASRTVAGVLADLAAL